MNQNIWGSTLWFSLHTITMNYPTNPTFSEIKDYKNFFISLQYVIPCTVCRRNYQRHLKEHPIDDHLSSRKKLVFWLIDIHNMVNAEIGKKIMSYDNVIDKYEKIYNKKIFDGHDENTNKLIITNKKYIFVFLICLIILILVGIYYIYINYNN